MSAIFGVLERDGAAADRRQLALMDTALTGHGPDGQGCWTDGPVGLGHRLTCLTPEDRSERQPLVAQRGEVVLVVDGRIDNRPELVSELDIPAAEARTLPDSVFVLRAYERWGQRCLERVVGEFAFAVWDGRTRRLVAGCSAPLGRPLCYHSTARRFAFATRPRGLHALPDVERRVDEERVAGFLAFVDTGRSRSFYRDVHRLLPGQLLIVDAGGPRVTAWWKPDLGRELALRSDDEYLAAFNELFRRVIADHLRGSEPIGMLLSGGLDSGSVAAAAAELLGLGGRPLSAYTEVPPADFDSPMMAGRYADETPFVREIARMYPNIELELLRGCHRGLLHDVDRYFAAAEVPFRNAANRGWIEAIYDRARRAGVRVLLTGDQGNLAVSWNGSELLPGLLRQRRVGRALRESRALARAGRANSTWRAILAQGVRPLLPPAVNGGIEWLRGAPEAHSAHPWEARSLINPAFAAEHGLTDRIDGPRTRHLASSAGSRTVRLRTLLETGSLGAEVGAGYRAMFGIDTRTPLADRRLVEFCLSVPEEQFAREGETRLLIRRAMAGRLPTTTLHNRERGLQAADWCEQMGAERGALLGEVDRFEADDLTSRVLDLPRLRRLLQQWSPGGFADPRTVSLYRGGVGMALMTGRFLLWTSGH